MLVMSVCRYRLCNVCNMQLCKNMALSVVSCVRHVRVCFHYLAFADTLALNSTAAVLRVHLNV
jgi:hypothetical protein